jgi:hypothetical protein
VTAALAIEAIQVSTYTNVVLTERHTIEIRHDVSTSSVAVEVPNVEKLIRALREMDLIKAEHVATAERLAKASEPIDQATRSAIFAALKETYDRDLEDSERREVVSKLAGHEIYSMSKRGNMTMADAHRVLDALSTLRDFR